MSSRKGARRAAFAVILVALVAGGLASLVGSDLGPSSERAGVDEPEADAPPTSLGDLPKPAPRRERARNRVGQPLVLEADEAARVAAVAKLVEAVAQAGDQEGAQNLRRMVLPGAQRESSEVWELNVAPRNQTHVSAPSSLALRDRANDLPRFDSPPLSKDGLLPREGASDDGEFDDKTLHTKGLRADYYDFLEGGITSVPDMAPLPPSFTRIDKSIDFATDASFELPFEPETFGTLWRGYLICDVAGLYDFTAGSDDGVRLRIDDTVVLEYGSLRPYAETRGSIELTAGRHKIEVGFYENYVFASCRLFWRPPGAPESVLVPRDAFELPDELAAIVPPAIQSLSRISGLIGDTVTIRGRGFSASPLLNRVTFAGVEAAIVSASEDELVVTVPLGASTGNVVVQVGPISTRPRSFTVDNVLGLFAEYYQVGSPLEDYPDFEKTAPYFVRVDGPVDFPEDDLWDLPYEPDVFAARWFGYLYVPAEDDYEITLGSDDGGQLKLDDEVFVDLPGLHPYETGDARAHFAAGFHKIEMKFFENYGRASLRLMWKRRGDAEPTPIPRGFLFAPDEIATRPEPIALALEPATASTGDEITIRGAAFGASLEFVRVEFPGNVWVRPSTIADDRLTVRVPYGAQSGDVRVHSGIRSSAPLRFTLGEPMGLRGDYYELLAGEVLDLATLPATLATRSVVSTRNDTQFRFGSIAQWGTRVAASDFAVHWSGAISVETAQSIQFAVQSESAVLIHVDGQAVMSDLDPHTLRENFGGVRLTPGEHAVDIWFVGRGGTGRLHVFYTPYGRADHLELPANWLRPRAPR